MPSDYLIKNGTLLSVTDGTARQTDLRVENGIITEIGQDLSEAEGCVIDAAGTYITTGWLDAHCHFAVQGSDISIDPVKDILCQGVTWAVDMGSLGPLDYRGRRDDLLHGTDLHGLAYMNIAKLGVPGSSKPVDFEGPWDIDEDLVLEVGRRYHDELLGLKARIDEKFCFDPIYVMEKMRSLGNQLDLPIAVHAPRSRIGIEVLLTYLKKGDVLCHTLAGNSEAMDILDSAGRVRECVSKARERGVIFDLSHGTNAYSYTTAEAAWRAGFFVDTISSDLHGRNLNGPVFSLGTVLTKMRGLTGMPWWQLLNRTIAEPVRLQHIKGKELDVRTGIKADLTIFRIEQGAFELTDSRKEKRTFTERPVPVFTCVGPRIYECRKTD